MEPIVLVDISALQRRSFAHTLMKFPIIEVWRCTVDKIWLTHTTIELCIVRCDLACAIDIGMILARVSCRCGVVWRIIDPLQCMTHVGCCFRRDGKSSVDTTILHVGRYPWQG